MAKPDPSKASDADGKKMPPRARASRPRTAPARAPRMIEDIVSTLPDMPLPDEAGLDPPSRRAMGLPERKYSFNALIAVGIAGFLVGRLLSR
ncbi:hypothetical protein LGR54_16900 [Ancylobacter sp. Lp-2]|uniref:hypothetical protein n=1 Tax=Ancylobacter sp. Lp-2 TaxID=2881339 RepID=UPI001E381581|nr:hypothetical protein [Ancylobacter sp. Lp-2]MCB4770292.1 hypothetical protein [Ancylobacter sp. Lp-2]